MLSIYMLLFSFGWKEKKVKKKKTKKTPKRRDIKLETVIKEPSDLKTRVTNLLDSAGISYIINYSFHLGVCIYAMQKYTLNFK